MPANRVHPRTFTKCGHKGLGGFCHRCAEADRMIAISEGKVEPAQPGKGRPKTAKAAFLGWKKEAFVKEAARLKAPAVRKANESNYVHPTNTATAD